MTTTTGPTGSILIDANTFSTPANVTSSAGNVIVQANALVPGAGVSMIAGTGINNAIVQGVNVTVNASGTTSGVFLESIQSPPAFVTIQSTQGGAVAVSAPNAVSPIGITIETNNGGSIEISSVFAGVFGPMGLVTSGDFNINNMDTVVTGANNTLIIYGDGTNKFEANNFNFIANTGGIYQIQQIFQAAGSTATFSANNNFTMLSSSQSPGNQVGIFDIGLIGAATFNITGALDMELVNLSGAVGTLEIHNGGTLHVTASGGDITLNTNGNAGNVIIAGSDIARVISTTGNINLDGVNGTASIGTGQALTVGAGQNIILGVNSSLFHPRRHSACCRRPKY